MRKFILLGILAFSTFSVHAQVKGKKNSVPSDKLPIDLNDTSVINDFKNNLSDNIPVITLDDNDLGDGSSQNVSSTLTASRDPFYSAVSFNFSAVRVRMRGYDGDNQATYMNGIPMENLDNGFTPFGLWGGLNPVMRNRDIAIGISKNTFGFGDIGSSTNIDCRASKQRKQTEFGYAYSNSSITHRWSLSHSTGFNKNGWAFSFSGSRRWADEGYVPGTYYNGWSYFVGVDKKISNNSILSLTVFGAPTESGKQAPVVQEVRKIMGDNYYNPYWGYQNGKKRNGYLAKTNQPYIILNHDYKFNNKSSLVTGLGLSFGERGSTGIDWYNAANPSPVYYRNLPSNYDEYPVLQDQIADVFRNDPSVSQVDWNRFYNANRSDSEIVNGTNGKRSRYIQNERVINTNRVILNTTYNTQLLSNIEFSAGFSAQVQRNNYYAKVLDLLGGDYFVDLNQFALRDYPNSQSANQNNLNSPDNIVRVGDRYGYDYNINLFKSSAWSQAVFKFSRLDYFLGIEISNTQFRRVGNFKVGLFPDNSFGPSDNNNFNNYALKGGVTYKIDGRNYLYVNGTTLTRAPMFDNVYQSARTRDTRQDNVQSETVNSVEGGYILNAPKIHGRITGYYTQFKNQMDVTTFFHDDYQNFVNYALNNIGKVHFGTEIGVEAKSIDNFYINAAAGLGRYYYNSRPTAVTTINNSSDIVAKDLVYQQNYRIGSTPQEVYTLGVNYRSPKFWSIGFNANYFDQMWIDINPVRRTIPAVEGLNDKDPLLSQILDQEKLPAKYTVDFDASYSYKLPRSLGLKKNTFLNFNFAINNILDNKDIITGGFEQPRFDYKERNPNKFPTKYFYSYGLTYSLAVSLRF